MKENIKSLLKALSDKPTKEDLLHFDDYAKNLADVILFSETPSTIGIFGNWGSGKTSLMLMIEENLKSQNVQIIKFNAWKYDKEDVLWRTLIITIMESLNINKEIVDETSIRLYKAISEDVLGKIEIDWMEVGKFLTKLVMIAVSPLLLIPGLAGDLHNLGLLDQISKSFTRKAIKQTQEKMSTLEEFEKTYKKIINGYFEKQKSGQERIVVFIDDLDRCVPVRALEVLEALKSFLDAEGCVYVIACDTRLINQGLQAKYSEKSGIELDDYLGKIVQFAFAIPPIRPEDAESFIKGLGLAFVPDEIARMISVSLERNPRKIKRFLSNLEIQNQLVLSRDLEIEKVILFKMACISYGWKQIWEIALSNKSVLSELQKFAVKTDLENTIGVAPFIKETFERDGRLKIFLSQEPYFSERDIDNYIFLAKATNISVSDEASGKMRKKEIETDQTPTHNEVSRASHLASFRNPFIAGVPISQSETFFGREEVLDEIIKQIGLSDSSVISLYGQRRIGKTSLLLNLNRILAGMDFISVFVDMQGYAAFVDSSQKFLGRLAYSIQSAFSEHERGKRIRNNSELSFVEFEVFIDYVRKRNSNKKIVLLIDEYEEMFSQYSRNRHWQQDVLKYFRSLITSQQGLCLIFCGSRSLFEVSRVYPDQTTSPFFNVARAIKLGYFAENVSRKFLLTHLPGMVDYHEDAIELVVKKIGGHPLLLQAAGSAIFLLVTKNEDKNLLEITDLKQIFNEMLDFFNHIFEFYFNTAEPAQRYIINRFAHQSLETGEINIEAIEELNAKNSIGNSLQSQLARLCELDLLKKGSRNDYQFVIPLFADYLRKKYQPYEEFED